MYENMDIIKNKIQIIDRLIVLGFQLDILYLVLSSKSYHLTFKFI